MQSDRVCEKQHENCSKGRNTDIRNVQSSDSFCVFKKQNHFMKVWRHRLTVLKKKQSENAVIIYITANKASLTVKTSPSKESREFVLSTL